MGRNSFARLFLFAVLLVALIWAVAAPAQALEMQVYVVQPGDTLYRIAVRFGATVDEICAINGIADPRLIAVGQELLIPSPSAVATPTPQAGVYVVQPGDTLSQIARRFGTTVEALAEVNRIENPALISVGQELLIPAVAIDEGSQPPPPAGPSYRRVHRVRAGETLPFLAFRYGTTPSAIVVANDLSLLGLLLPGQGILIPAPTAATQFTPLPPQVTVRPTPVVQGQTLLVRVRGQGVSEVTGQALGEALTFAPIDDGYFALLGVGALTAPGSYRLRVTVKEEGTGDRVTIQESIRVVAGEFSLYNVTVPDDRQALLDPTLSRSEAQKVNQVFARATPVRQWDGTFGLPLTGELYVTAAFGQRRSYNGGPVSSYHGGLDYGAPTGTPVLAPAAATVVMAEPLQVRGSAVILDHGLGVMTGFWHLSQIDVTVGQSVARGEVVGLVGNTGLSTGAHLHWEMRVRGVPVDPLQWTKETFP